MVALTPFWNRSATEAFKTDKTIFKLSPRSTQRAGVALPSLYLHSKSGGGKASDLQENRCGPLKIKVAQLGFQPKCMQRALHHIVVGILALFTRSFSDWKD